MPEYLFVSLFVCACLMTSLSQVLMKIGVNCARNNSILPVNLLVITSYFLLSCTTLLTVYSMQGISFAIANSLLPLVYIFTFIFSHFILRENIDIFKILSMCLIVTGIVITFS